MGCVPSCASAISLRWQQQDRVVATATKEVKSAGKFVFPGFCMIKTRLKPATKAGEREVFGKMVMVKAKPAKTIVKAFPVAALKKSI